VYEHEHRALFRAAVVIATVLILAIISAIVFIIYQEMRISNAAAIEFAKLAVS
jgi:hypothetical protein